MKMNGRSTSGRPASVPGASGDDSGRPGGEFFVVNLLEHARAHVHAHLGLPGYPVRVEAKK